MSRIKSRLRDSYQASTSAPENDTSTLVDEVLEEHSEEPKTTEPTIVEEVEESEPTEPVEDVQIDIEPDEKKETQEYVQDCVPDNVTDTVQEDIQEEIAQEEAQVDRPVTQKTFYVAKDTAKMIRRKARMSEMSYRDYVDMRIMDFYNKLEEIGKFDTEQEEEDYELLERHDIAIRNEKVYFHVQIFNDTNKLFDKCTAYYAASKSTMFDFILSGGIEKI